MDAAEIVALADAVGVFFSAREDAFPEATAEQWASADAADPDAVTADGQWLLRFRCFAIRLPGGRVILVDAGVGPAGPSAAGWPPGPGRLPDAMAEVGIAAGDVDTVVLTHLHSDHTGWAVTGDEPFFHNARYLLQAAEVSALAVADPDRCDRLLTPLRRADQLDVLAGDARLAAGVRVIATPGHTPGHQSVLVSATSTAEPVLISGDLLVHAVQLLHPDLGYAYEADQDEARASRVALLRQLAEVGGVLATAHLGRAFTPVTGA